MKVYRIHISSWTASFRFPNIISGFQPTLPVPPLSTIYGLISAVLGRNYSPKFPEIGYVFLSELKAIDLETIYQMRQSLKEIKSNVVKRELLFNNDLWLYTQNSDIPDAFSKPYFQVLLGRSGDLASINEIREIVVEPREYLNYLKGTIIPFGKYVLAAPIQALPVYFSEDVPRRNLLTKPYYLLDSNYRQNQTIQASGFYDPEIQNEVYLQE